MVVPIFIKTCFKIYFLGLVKILIQEPMSVRGSTIEKHSFRLCYFYLVFFFNIKYFETIILCA